MQTIKEFIIKNEIDLGPTKRFKKGDTLYFPAWDQKENKFEVKSGTYRGEVITSEDDDFPVKADIMVNIPEGQTRCIKLENASTEEYRAITKTFMMNKKLKEELKEIRWEKAMQKYNHNK